MIQTEFYFEHSSSLQMLFVLTNGEAKFFYARKRIIFFITMHVDISIQDISIQEKL